MSEDSQLDINDHVEIVLYNKALAAEQIPSRTYYTPDGTPQKPLNKQERLMAQIQEAAYKHSLQKMHQKMREAAQKTEIARLQEAGNPPLFNLLETEIVLLPMLHAQTVIELGKIYPNAPQKTDTEQPDYRIDVAHHPDGTVEDWISTHQATILVDGDNLEIQNTATWKDTAIVVYEPQGDGLYSFFSCQPEDHMIKIKQNSIIGIWSGKQTAQQKEVYLKIDVLGESDDRQALIVITDPPAEDQIVSNR